MNGSQDFTLPSGLSFTTTTSPPSLVVLIPRAVAGDEDRVAIGSRKHLAGVKAHAERGRVRAEQRNRRLEVAAAAPPAKLVVGHIALVAIGIAEMLPGLGDAVELVVGQILRQPIAAVVGEIKLLRYRVEIKPDRVANSTHVGFRSAAVEIHAPDLSVGLGRKADVTGRSDVDVEPVVGSRRDEFPPMRLVVGELTVDNDGLRRIIEVAFDV